MTNNSTNALRLILVLFASIILSNPVAAGERGAIGATLVSVTREPRADAALVAQLRQGDVVDVVERQSAFTKISFRIDGDFLLTGWIPNAALASNLKESDFDRIQSREQRYSPRSKGDVITEVETFPDLSASSTLAAGQKSITPLTVKGIEKDTRSSLDQPVARKARKPGAPQLTIELSAVNFQEQLKTKNPNDATSGYYPGSFLSYELNGAALTGEGSIGYELDWIRVGGFAHYSFIYFSDGISGNPYVNTSNVQATVHQIELGPTFQREFLLGDRWKLIPEFRAIVGYQDMAVNQLTDSRQNQPVLMNLQSYQGRVELLSRLELPYDNLFIEPMVGLTLYQSFSESPNINVDANGAAISEGSKIRTGSPKSKILQLHYGATLGMRLVDWDLSDITLYFKIRVQDDSRDYSGIGNRAGFKVSEVKSTTTLTTLALGLQKEF